MSNTPEDTTTSTPTSLGMATSTMVLNHIDYASPFMGKMFLLIIDAHSKWLDIHIPNSSNTKSTVEKLHMRFANHGLPDRKHRKRSGRKNRRRNIIESNEYQAGLPYFQTSISNPFLQVNPYQFVGPTQSFAHPNTNLRSVAQQTYSQLNHLLSQQNPYFFALQPPTFGSTSTTNNTRIHMGVDNSNLEINSQAGQDDDQNSWYNLDTLVKAATHLEDN